MIKKRTLGQLKDREIEAQLSNLRLNNNFSNNCNSNNNNIFGGRPTGNLPEPPPPLPSPGAPDKPFDRVAWWLVTCTRKPKVPGSSPAVSYVQR